MKAKATVLLKQYFFSYFQLASGQSPLSIEIHHARSCWMGTFPSNVRWSEDSQKIYFKYNSEKGPADSLYSPYQKLGQNHPVQWSEEKITWWKRFQLSKRSCFPIFKRRFRKLFWRKWKSGKVSTILDGYSDFSNPTIFGERKRNRL